MPAPFALPGTGSVFCPAERSADRADEQPGARRVLTGEAAAGGTAAYSPAKAVDGYARPYTGPHMWVSEPLRDGVGACLELTCPQPVTLSRIDVLADDDVNEDLINPHQPRTPFDTLPTLLRDCRVEAREADGNWRTVARTTDNRRRHQVHTLVEPVTSTALRTVVEATNGAPSAHVVPVRAYGWERTVPGGPVRRPGPVDPPDRLDGPGESGRDSDEARPHIRLLFG
ncbi:hypothetical protein [Streptomyces sp. NPDC102437]|uniref:hypothetical protein n=1 Tax=Streptomyces sp. NPDC102437 TaxID=3366175 RepID=UPI003827FBE4